jgi:Undecaprenyl-phosphate glucose phosphotransferase
VLAFALTSNAAIFEVSTVVAILTIPWLVVGVLSAKWSYSISALRRPASQIGKVLTALAIVALVSNGLLFLSGSKVIQPSTTLAWISFAFLLLAVSRVAVAHVIHQLAKSGRLRRRAVIVGGGEDADSLVDMLREESAHLAILGMFDDRTANRDGSTTREDGVHRLGTFDELAAFCRDTGVELLIVSVPAAAEERILQIINKLLTLPVDIRISAHNSKLRFNRSAYSYIGKVPMLPILDRPLSDRDRLIKNIEDRIVGLAMLIVAAPFMALVALAVRLESKGPVLFRQKRLGFNNELIEVYKFRSMYTDMSDAAAAKLVTRDDPRVTRVGRFIRKTSLDELPQIFNVLRGEMSIVGPRPHALQAKAGDDLYHDAVRIYFARHKVKPGITGWAQVNGWRGETDTLEKIEQRVEHDMHYIDNWSVLFDLYIIAITPFSLIGGKNAY